MRLYYAPLACSLAVRAALDEAGMEAQGVRVRDGDAEGRPYAEVNPLGYVPALELQDGRILTEGPAILQWIADKAPQARLAPPPGTDERTEMQAWLNFISAELHKGLFSPLLDKTAPGAAKDYVVKGVASRLGHLEARLSKVTHLAGEHSVADLYLLAVLNWCELVGIELAIWPNLGAYRERMRRRPSVARAMEFEMALYRNG